jgi:hypothetical protein
MYGYAIVKADKYASLWFMRRMFFGIYVFKEPDLFIKKDLVYFKIINMSMHLTTKLVYREL